MKKVIIFSLVLLALLLTTSPVSAWYNRHYNSHYSFGVFIGPPFFYFPPPPVYYAPPPAYYWPPPNYYGGYYPPYYPPGYRVWVPGYWDYRQTPYGWERAWVPGHWEWRD